MIIYTHIYQGTFTIKGQFGVINWRLLPSRPHGKSERNQRITRLDNFASPHSNTLLVSIKAETLYGTCLERDLDTSRSLQTLLLLVNPDSYAISSYIASVQPISILR